MNIATEFVLQARFVIAFVIHCIKMKYQIPKQDFIEPLMKLAVFLLAM